MNGENKKYAKCVLWEIVFVDAATAKESLLSVLLCFVRLQNCNLPTYSFGSNSRHTSTVNHGRGSHPCS